MPTPKITDDEFIAAWRRCGGAEAVARETGLTIRAIYARRANVENKRGIVLQAAETRGTPRHNGTKLPQEGIRRTIDGFTGTAIIFSDAHFWPGETSVAFKALLMLIKELKPDLIVANGDVFDGSRISRHDRIGWEQRPSLKDELAACVERMEEIRTARRTATHVWNWGNHCIRFARYLAMNAPDMEGVPGAELTDHVKHWEAGWSLAINGHTMVKHRYRNGIHAAYNNALTGGWSIFTGHLHRLIVTPWADYNGRRWGVDTGTLADIGPQAGQFAYSEDDPKPWGSGFAVATFDKRGMLLPPELVEVINGKAYFRGGVVT